MTPEQRAKLNPVWKEQIREAVEAMVREACGINYGQNYKKYVPLMELINYKTDKSYRYSSNEKDSVKFQRYIEATDKLITLVNGKWPFIDLEGIDLSWTSDQIVHQVMVMYESIPVMKFDGVQPEMKDNTEDIKKIEQIFREHFKIGEKEKFKKNEYLSRFAFTALGMPYNCNDKELYQKAVEFVKEFETKVEAELPHVYIGIGTWMTFTKIINAYNKANKF